MTAETATASGVPAASSYGNTAAMSQTSANLAAAAAAPAAYEYPSYAAYSAQHQAAVQVQAVTATAASHAGVSDVTISVAPGAVAQLAPTAAGAYVGTAIAPQQALPSSPSAYPYPHYTAYNMQQPRSVVPAATPGAASATTHAAQSVQGAQTPATGISSSAAVPENMGVGGGSSQAGAAASSYGGVAAADPGGATPAYAYHPAAYAAAAAAAATAAYQRQYYLQQQQLRQQQAHQQQQSQPQQQLQQQQQPQVNVVVGSAAQQDPYAQYHTSNAYQGHPPTGGGEGR